MLKNTITFELSPSSIMVVAFFVVIHALITAWGIPNNFEHKHDLCVEHIDAQDTDLQELKEEYSSCMGELD